MDLELRFFLACKGRCRLDWKTPIVVDEETNELVFSQASLNAA